MCLGFIFLSGTYIANSRALVPYYIVHLDRCLVLGRNKIPVVGCLSVWGINKSHVEHPSVDLIMHMVTRHCVCSILGTKLQATATMMCSLVEELALGADWLISVVLVLEESCTSVLKRATGRRSEHQGLVETCGAATDSGDLCRVVPVIRQGKQHRVF